jgi:hypothetical protein
MRELIQIDWPRLIDEFLLRRIIDYARDNPDDVDTAYLTGSYAQGTWNPHRPNVNLYLIATPRRAEQVRLTLGRIFADVQRDLHAEDVDFTVDCHPYTISQRDPAWSDRPLLTLTTKVLAGEAAADRYHISPTIGLGWSAAHKILVGRPDAHGVLGLVGVTAA